MKSLSVRGQKIQNTIGYIQSVKRKTNAAFESAVNKFHKDAKYLDDQEKRYKRALELEINPGEDGVNVNATSEGANSFTFDGKELIDLDNEKNTEGTENGESNDNPGGEDTTQSNDFVELEKEMKKAKTYYDNVYTKLQKAKASKK